jgi:hypothetical protein
VRAADGPRAPGGGRPLGLVLAGVAVSTYGAGLAWAAGRQAAALWRWPARTPAPATPPWAPPAGWRRRRRLLPRLWWTNSGYIVTGGGTSDVGNAGENLSGLASELLSGADSYYFFDGRPALAGAGIAILGLLGLGLARRRARGDAGCGRSWSCSWARSGLYAIAGGVLGVRRAIAIP